MPTYGYRCTVCAHEFERVQKMTDPALTDCESCGGAVKKIIYPVGIQFKGSGFYVNDYAKSAPKGDTDTPAATAETTAAGEASGTETAKTDAAKTDAAPAAKTDAPASPAPAPATPAAP